MEPTGRTIKPARTWSREEDQKLRQAVARQEGESTTNWHEVASFIDGRNNKECRKRWVYALEPSINKGSWEPTEDDRLRAGVQAHGTKWAEVSRIVGSRHPDQCSKRWHEVLKPNINRERWSLAEDEALKSAVATHGRRWIEIVERYFPDRTPIGTRNRYLQLERREAESGETDTMISDGSPGPGSVPDPNMYPPTTFAPLGPSYPLSYDPSIASYSSGPGIDPMEGMQIPLHHQQPQPQQQPQQRQAPAVNVIPNVYLPPGFFPPYFNNQQAYDPRTDPSFRYPDQSQ